MSAPIRIAIRADAGRMLGAGHMARTSAVADVLSACDTVELVLLVNRDAAALVPNFFPAGMDVIVVDDEASDPPSLLQQLEVDGRLPDVVYLDHYGEVPQWEAAAAVKGVRLLVIDDLDAASSADAIVRPHGGDKSAGDAIVLRGPAYLPLSRHVIAAASKPRTTPAPARLRLNACFGGTDPTGETAKVIDALSATTGVDANVVVGPGAKLSDRSLSVAGSLPHVTLQFAPSQSELAQMMGEADVALGAGGVMLWERMCIGLPSLVIAVADNQRPQIDAMAKVGAIRFLGDHADVTAAQIAEAIEALVADTEARVAMRKIGQSLVDGRGAQRIAARLRALALDVRDVTASDGPHLYEWRTDDRNWQHNWGRSDKPELTDHLAWLSERLGEPRCIFRIVMWQGDPVGVVRFDLSEDGSHAYLSIYLVPAWHGQRMGLPVLFAAERALRRSHPQVERMVSRIDQENAASVRLHRDAGFQFKQSVERADWYDAWKELD